VRYTQNMQWLLADGGELELWPDFIAESQRQGLFDELRRDLAWQSRELRIAGRLVLEPRLTAWYGDPGAEYTYSGRRHSPLPWPPQLFDLRERLNERTHAQLNSVLCNLYRDGSDSMGLHADAEPELGENPLIASISLGATRRFQLRHRRRAEERLDLDLPSGSVLIMRGTLQHHYRHGVPKQRAIAQPRINLTFRRILSPLAHR
jgi:alkylated DNA repair dioxygenase AlkB